MIILFFTNIWQRWHEWRNADRAAYVKLTKTNLRLLADPDR